MKMVLFPGEWVILYKAGGDLKRLQWYADHGCAVAMSLGIMRGNIVEAALDAVGFMPKGKK